MKRVVVVLCLFSLILVGIAAVSQEAADLIAEANAAFDRWTGAFEFSAYQERLETAVSLWEQALPLIPEDDAPTRAPVLNRLAQAYFELGEAYLVAGAGREEAYGKGKEYALASLRLDPLFGTTEESEGFRAALYSASDVAAVQRAGDPAG